MRMLHRLSLPLLALLLGGLATYALAQVVAGGGGLDGGATGGGYRGFGGRGGRGFGGGEYMRGNEAIDIPLDRNGIAVWPTDPQFKSDMFTFVRLRFTNGPRDSSGLGGGFGGGFGGGRNRGGTATSWLNDWPEADMNISFRLQQMTSMKVNPTPIRLAITDPALLNYPFAIMEQVGAMQLSDEEVLALRRWLLNGGFLMVDDHWGGDLDHFAEQMSRVLPKCQPQVLTLEHPIFHTVFDLKALPQVPTLQTWEQDARDGHPEQTARRPDYSPPIYRAYNDDKGRLMVLEDGNTDTPDAWEREGDDEEYFHRFAEKVAYPFMINVVFYVMSH